MRIVSAALAAAVAGLLPAVAMAHTGVDHASGFAHGMAHPAGGLDHVLAMVLVGVLAFQMGGRARLLLPASFVGVMAVGGLAGMAGFTLPLVEAGIALSIVVLGAAVAFGVRAPMAVAMGLVGFFAIFHGYAHGAEMPANAGGLGYAAGFLLATAALHAAGLGLGWLVARGTAGGVMVRTAGGVATLAGIAILTGVL
ncbi:urease accessory protein [Stella humosa]|uniref:Urease accessory protein n=1 Tax=Stella humosa TaxID=94 RepID=A0A3N1KUX8_9PROT|nr:HupE/UreJ family protein [Stella humosa]ROP84391.1 urease accessory protein [Stella humosa]BBK33907.1 urease accessory protein UreJ [Stella humosa]